MAAEKIDPSRCRWRGLNMREVEARLKIGVATCKRCGKEFAPHRIGHVFCSKRCCSYWQLAKAKAACANDGQAVR